MIKILFFIFVLFVLALFSISIYKNLFGISILFFVYFSIFVIYLSKDFLKNKDLNFILVFLEKKIVFVIVFYISLTTTFFSAIK